MTSGAGRRWPAWPAGDRALVQIADRLRHAVRPTDLVARFAGEEFVCLLPDTDADVAGEIAERLRAMLSGNPLAIAEGRQVSVTASAGVAGATGGSGAVVLENAGRALHRAKETGRDRTVIAEGWPPIAGRIGGSVLN